MARMNSTILKRLGDLTQVGGRTFRAYYRHERGYTNLDERHIVEDVEMHISENDYDPEVMQVDSPVHNVDEDSRWKISTYGFIKDGRVRFELVKDRTYAD